MLRALRGVGRRTTGLLLVCLALLALSCFAVASAKQSGGSEQVSLQPSARASSSPAHRLRASSLVESGVAVSASASTSALGSASLRQLARARQALQSWERFALSTNTFFGTQKAKARGAGGRAGRAGPYGKAASAAGNGAQSGRKAGDAAGTGAQSGRKAGDASGTGAQSGRKAGDASGTGAQSGRKAGDTSGTGAQSGRKAGDTSGTGAQSGRKAGDSTTPAAIVSPILGNPPPSSANVFVVPIERLVLDKKKPKPGPVRVYMRNQGDGPTCWAHSAVQLYEMALQMVLYKDNDLPGWFSVDQVVKCVKSEPDGGNPLDALQFIMTHHLMLDADVRAGKPIECKKRKWGMVERGHYSPTLVFKPCIKPGEDCRRMSKYEPIMARTFLESPLLVWVDASQWFDYKPVFTRGKPISDYSKVAFDAKKCSMDPQKGDHLVTLLGYDTDPRTGRSYWRAYNSWGTQWGVDGLIYLPYGENACGLANYPVGLHGTLIDDGFNTSRPLAMLPTDMKWSVAMATKDFKAGMMGLTGGIIDI